MSNERQRIQADLKLEELKDKAREWNIIVKENLELRKEIERLNNIIKEVREYIEKHQCCGGKINVMTLTEYKELLEILDKGGSDKIEYI